MYATIREKSDNGAVRKYASAKTAKSMPKSITKKGSFLDPLLKSNISPGPASTIFSIKDKSNHQVDWSKTGAIPQKHSERKTYITEIQHFHRKTNSPSPSQYTISMNWPKKNQKQHLESEKTNFINTSEYASVKTPGPGNYLIATSIENRKIKKYKFLQTFPRQST